MKLSILIPSVTDRSHFLESLLARIDAQKNGHNVEVLVELDNRKASIGAKRNTLLQKATGDYTSFIDDDDAISADYLDLVFEGISKEVDCCSLTGMYYENGKPIKPFIHSLGTDRYWEDNIAYYRYPNHLNCIKSSISKQFKFPEEGRLGMHGEDTDWATQIHQAGALKTQHMINGIIYHYYHISDK